MTLYGRCQDIGAGDGIVCEDGIVYCQSFERPRIADTWINADGYLVTSANVRQDVSRVIVEPPVHA